MQSSQKQKIFSHFFVFFFALSQSTLHFEHFQIKDDPDS